MKRKKKILSKKEMKKKIKRIQEKVRNIEDRPRILNIQKNGSP